MILPCTKQPRIRLDPAAYGELRRQVLKRDGWRCQACARRSRYPEPSERILGRLEFLAYSSFQWTFQERGRSWHDPVETGLSFQRRFISGTGAQPLKGAVQTRPGKRSR